MFFWLAAKIVVDGFVPELLHQLPRLDLARPDDVVEVVGLGMLEGLLANVEVKLRIEKLILFRSSAGFLQKLKIR